MPKQSLCFGYWLGADAKKMFVSQYNAGEWRVAAEHQGPGLSKAGHFSSWRLTDSEIQTQVRKGWLDNMLSSSLS